MDFTIEAVSSMEELELDPSSPPCLYLISAFFAMEPTGCLISLARKCGGGSITNEVQSLIWEHCINKAMSKDHTPTNLYVKNFLKKLILEVESSGDAVLDGLYGQFAHYITSVKVGSGVGLVGISLALVKASEVILTDGDVSTLATLKRNLKLNQLDAESEILPRTSQDATIVKCKHLSWEFASETDLQVFAPDIVLGADVMYDRLSFPHLVRVLSILLKPKVSNLNNADEHLATTPAPPVAYIATVIRNIDTYNCFVNLTSQANLSVVDITENQKPLNLLSYMQSYDRSTIRLLTISRN